MSTKKGTGGNPNATPGASGCAKLGASPAAAAAAEQGLAYDESKAKIPPELNKNLSTAQENVQKAKDLKNKRLGEKSNKVVSVNGGEHVSGYGTAESKTPKDFSPIGRDPVNAVERDKAIGHTPHKNASIDPEIHPDGTITGAPGKAGENGERIHGKTVDGGQAATHAEKQAMQEQQAKGTNHPVGISKDQCGDCRKQHRQHATNKNRPGYPDPYIAGEPAHSRVYNADGSIDVYKPTTDGGHAYVGTALPEAQPSASIAKYEGIAW